MFSTNQITALTAQTATFVAETYPAYDADGELLPDWQLNVNGEPIYLGTEIATRGVGVYGQSPSALTLAGFLKPGTIDAYLQDPENTLAVLLNASVWTGQYGITGLEAYLDFPVLQNLAQQALIAGSYQGLINAGLLDGTETARFQAALVQPAAQYGVDTVINWVNATLPSSMISKIKIAARQGQYAIDFVETYSLQLNLAPELPAYTNTVERTELDKLVTDIIGNQKIPNIEFSDPSVQGGTPQATDAGLGTFRFATGNK